MSRRLSGLISRSRDVSADDLPLGASFVACQGGSLDLPAVSMSMIIGVADRAGPLASGRLRRLAA
jgi:hypothetical protein